MHLNTENPEEARLGVGGMGRGKGGWVKVPGGRRRWVGEVEAWQNAHPFPFSTSVAPPPPLRQSRITLLANHNIS